MMMTAKYRSEDALSYSTKPLATLGVPAGTWMQSGTRVIPHEWNGFKVSRDAAVLAAEALVGRRIERTGQEHYWWVLCFHDGYHVVIHQRREATDREALLVTLEKYGGGIGTPELLDRLIREQRDSSGNPYGPDQRKEIVEELAFRLKHQSITLLHEMGKPEPVEAALQCLKVLTRVE